MKPVLPALLSLVAALALAGCKKDEDPPEETDTDADADADSDTDADTDTDSDTDADTDTDPGPVTPGEGSLTLAQYLPGNVWGGETLQLMGVFVEDLQGIPNAAECYPQAFNFCFDQFPAVEDTYIEHNDGFDPSAATFQDVGPLVGLGAYTAQRFSDPALGTFYNDLQVPPLMGGQDLAVQTAAGGVWGAYQGVSDIVTPPPLDVIAPDLAVGTVDVIDGGTVDFEWVPDPSGNSLVTLLVATGGNPGSVLLQRTYLLEDDGAYSLDVDDLGLNAGTIDVTFVLARSVYEDVDINGNPLHVGVRSEGWIFGIHPPITGRDPITGMDTCDVAAPLLAAGSYYDTLTGAANDYDPTNAGCAGAGLPGPDRAFRVDVPAGQRITASVDLFRQDGAIYLLEDCADLASCRDGADYGFDGPEVVQYTNTTASDETLYLIVDTWDMFAEGFFLLDVGFDTPGTPTDAMYDTCALAQANRVLDPGVYTIDLSEATDHTNPGAFGCTGFDAPGPDVVAAVDVPGNSVVKVTTAAPVAMYLLEDCPDEGTCRAGAAPYVPLELFNPTPQDRVGYLVVDEPGDPGLQGPFEIELTVLPVSQVAPAQDCATAATGPTFSTGTHVLQGDLTGYSATLDLANPGPSCTGFESDGEDGVINIHLEAGETLAAAYEQIGGDGVLYLLEVCTDTQSTLACADGIPPLHEDFVYVNGTGAAQDLFLVVDNWGGGGFGPPGGPFSLRLDIY